MPVTPNSKRGTPKVSDYAPSKQQQIAVAEQQIDQFKNERFGHQMNLARLDAVPEDARDSAWSAAVRQGRDAIAQIESAIDSTRAAIASINSGTALPRPEPVEDEPTPDEPIAGEPGVE
jgi:hypothetical protein